MAGDNLVTPVMATGEGGVFCSAIRAGFRYSPLLRPRCGRQLLLNETNQDVAIDVKREASPASQEGPC
jgi:hypothetical protein